MSIFLGIDFGTSTNVVTCWNMDKKEAVPVPMGKYGASNAYVFPNVIYYESEDNYIVGENAVQRGKLYPDNAVFFIKRKLETPDFSQYIPALGRPLTSKEIAADIFRWIKREVGNRFGGEDIGGVVISVPFAFQNRERKRIQSAAEDAGLNVYGLIEEPVAAALSFGLAERTERGKNEKVLVFDLGGGTFDVTVFDFQKQSERQFAIRVLTTDGAKKLGGIDIDDLVARKIHEKMEMQYPDYRLDTRSSDLQKKEAAQIHQLAIEAKENWSVEEEVDFIFESNLGDQFIFDETLDVGNFNQWLREFLQQIRNVLDNALRDADMKRKDIDRIIMVGGTSIIPAVNEMVRDYFGKEPEHARQLNLMVGEGAGIYCGLKYVEKTMECKISIGVSQETGIKWKGKFISMLPRNTLYGTPSKLEILEIPKSGQNEIKLSIVQGNRIKNIKVAGIVLSAELQNKLSEGRLGLVLNTDVNNGTILYELYDIKDNAQKALLESGKAGEE